ncbi:MAG: hypothetical protein K2X47_12750, partial [Bdellovibrionales bacterium]|nr:hypothetical protein [Bdellovibrionales bacterium]
MSFLSQTVHQALVVALVFQAVTPVSWAQKTPTGVRIFQVDTKTGSTEIKDGKESGKETNGEKPNGKTENLFVPLNPEGSAKTAAKPEDGVIEAPISPEEKCLKKMVAASEDLTCMKYLPLNHRSVPISLIFHAMRSLDRYDMNQVANAPINLDEQMHLWLGARKNIQAAMQILNGYQRTGMPRAVRTLLNKALQEMPDFGPNR